MEELAKLIPEAELVSTAIGEFEVWPLRARQLAPFSKAVKPLIDEFNELFRRAESLSDTEWLSLCERRADDLVIALSTALEAHPERIGELFMDDLVALTTAVVRVNLDFFARRARPALIAAMAALLDGLMPCKSSTDPATEIPPNTT